GWAISALCSKCGYLAGCGAGDAVVMVRLDGGDYDRHRESTVCLVCVLTLRFAHCWPPASCLPVRQQVAALKIGRASCRERGWAWVAGGCIVGEDESCSNGQQVTHM